MIEKEDGGKKTDVMITKSCASPESQTSDSAEYDQDTCLHDNH